MFFQAGGLQTFGQVCSLQGHIGPTPSCLPSGGWLWELCHAEALEPSLPQLFTRLIMSQLQATGSPGCAPFLQNSADMEGEGGIPPERRGRENAFLHSPKEMGRNTSLGVLGAEKKTLILRRQSPKALGCVVIVLMIHD